MHDSPGLSGPETCIPVSYDLIVRQSRCVSPNPRPRNSACVNLEEIPISEPY